ncbi:MAG TPA: peptidylprolyl isomerase, partial [Myxococcota bacterium]|nr:peptidylprolyl isomerase [Myxococcota bacterium]
DAAWALARLGATSARPELRATLQSVAHHDYDPLVRAWLVRAWAGVALPGERLEGLPALLSDRDPGVRIAAARAVGKYGCADRPSLLEPLLKDEVAAVRQEAYAAAEACPGPAARLTELLGQHDALDDAALVEVLARRHELPDPMSWLADTWPLRVRVAALGAVRDRTVLMEWALNGEDAAMRSTAVSLLVEQATQAELLRLVTASDEAVVETAAEELKKRPDPKAEEPLLAVLGRPQLEASTAGACLRALSALYFTGKVPKVNPVAAERVQRQVQAWPKLREDAAPIAGLLGIKLPEAPPMVVPELAEILDMRALRIQTEAGEIRVELWPEVAPYTVYNFVKLAEKGYFDGLSFHRVVPEFVVQTGDPRGDGWGGPGYAIPDELNPAPYEAGVLGMALSGPDTGGSQWFITLRPQPHLDGAYTAFGRVTLGLDNARRVMAGDRLEKVIVERVQPVAGYAFP